MNNEVLIVFGVVVLIFSTMDFTLMKMGFQSSIWGNLKKYLIKRKYKKEQDKRNAWQANMYKKHPVIFQENSLDMTQTCMCWGIGVGPGWYKIIEGLCDELKELMTKHGGMVVAEQVKEKFATLRFYASYKPAENMTEEQAKIATKEMYGIIGKWENKTETTCEICGKPGTQDRSYGWIKTVCKNHSGAKRWKR